MNVSIQFAIAQSGHFSFPLLAEGTMRTPAGDLPIVEFGRSKAEVLQRVFGFADLHTQARPVKKSVADFLHEHEAAYWTNIQEAAQWVINCRELCGDEQQALRDWQDENGSLSQSARAHVWLRVQKIWNEARRAAGVKGSR